MNLLGVDVAHITNFCSYNNLLPGTILTLSIAIVFSCQSNWLGERRIRPVGTSVLYIFLSQYYSRS